MTYRTATVIGLIAAALMTGCSRPEPEHRAKAPRLPRGQFPRRPGGGAGPSGGDSCQNACPQSTTCQNGACCDQSGNCEEPGVRPPVVISGGSLTIEDAHNFAGWKADGRDAPGVTDAATLQAPPGYLIAGSDFGVFYTDGAYKYGLHHYCPQGTCNLDTVITMGAAGGAPAYTITVSMPSLTSLTINVSNGVRLVKVMQNGAMVFRDPTQTREMTSVHISHDMFKFDNPQKPVNVTFWYSETSP